MYFTVLKQQVLLVFINIIKGVNYYLHETLSLKIIYHNYRTSNHLKGKNTIAIIFIVMFTYIFLEACKNAFLKEILQIVFLKLKMNSC